MPNLDTAVDELDKVDRIEVIDETGRAYVRGSIYGSPVTVKLDYQDDGRTLKVFVEPNHDRSDGHVCSDCFDNGKGTYDRYGLAEKGTEE